MFIYYVFNTDFLSDSAKLLLHFLLLLFLYKQNMSGVVFFRFVDKENVTSVNQLKSSVQRGMKSKIIEQFPQIESIWDEIVPKKTGLKLVKW